MSLITLETIELKWKTYKPPLWGLPWEELSQQQKAFIWLHISWSKYLDNEGNYKVWITEILWYKSCGEPIVRRSNRNKASHLLVDTHSSKPILGDRKVIDGIGYEYTFYKGSQHRVPLSKK